MMMQPRDLVTVLVIGCAFIALGFVPGVFQRLIDGVQNFRDSLISPFPSGFHHQPDYDSLPRPLWLAGLGLALIIMSVLAYLVS
jgi:hypothetical protein